MSVTVPSPFEASPLAATFARYYK